MSNAPKQSEAKSIDATIGAQLAANPSGTICLYHGSIEQSLKNIIECGVSYEKAREFGKEGFFYTAVNHEAASVFAVGRSCLGTQGVAMVLKFDMPTEVVLDMSSKFQVLQNESGTVLKFLPPSFETLNATMTNKEILEPLFYNE